MICLENVVNTRLSPCGHLLCNICYDRLETPKCPKCKQNVTSGERIYFGGYKDKYLKYKHKYLQLKNSK